MSQKPSHQYPKPSGNNNSKEAPTNLEDGPPDAIAAKEARRVAAIRGFFWSDEFAAAVGRHKQYVSDHCRSRKIKTMRGGKPYRIPFSEYDAWMYPKP